MNAIDWLEQSAPGFQQLSPDERNAIMHFSFLWSLFEAKALNTNGNARAIVEAANLWQKEDLITDESFEGELEYFRDRYFADGEFTYHFDHLHFRRPDRREFVERVLRNEEAELSDIAAALLIIVYRFRSNLLHGMKWAYQIQGQLGNFTHANAVLMQAIELHERSSASA